MDDFFKKFGEFKKSRNIKLAKRGISRLYEGYGRLRKEVTKMQNLDDDYDEFVKVWKDRANQHFLSDARNNVLSGRFRVIRKRKGKVANVI